MKRSLSLIIPVYNTVQSLEYILTALQRQSMKDFEIIIADDGSGPDIRLLIEHIRHQFPFPITHLWQPDEGFRKNAILNKAIVASQTDYLVFIDGDCIPHREFLADHVRNRVPQSLLCGRRVNLSRQISDELTLNDIMSGRFERFSLRLLIDGLLAKSSNLEDGLRINNSSLRAILHRNKARILGSNFSVQKQLLEKINGFNEDYNSYGLGEDSDIAFRLQLLNVQLVSLRYQAVVYHLFHPTKQVSDENRCRYEGMIRVAEPICKNGLKKLE